jgi:hypothetical protein
MRLSRHFRPSLEPMSARIAPSTIALIPHGISAAPLQPPVRVGNNVPTNNPSGHIWSGRMVPATSSGDDTPTNDPSGDGSYPILPDVPPSGGTSTIC